MIAGSSPRVRGTQLRVVEDAPCLGIIPACAGNTSYDKNAGDATGDHPRVCGEHVQGPVLFGHLPGSSPRVRGTQEAAGLSAVLRGIIPACAGNTEFRRMLMISARDHPRVCGEHSSPFQSRFSPAGSSPRVRGTRIGRRATHTPGGIIPACAGNTVADSKSVFPTRDHPRVCGEHRAPPSGGGRRRGSSPRVRGTHCIPHRGRFVPGIIPACAGNTPPPQPENSPTRDHPRVCGEHSGWSGRLDLNRGSSPRVRGTQGR